MSHGRFRTVWRVQNKQGQGPDYVLGGELEDLLPDQLSQPDPYEDFELAPELLGLDNSWNSPYRFGFLKKQDAEKWYGKKGLRVLERLGFELVQLKASKVVMSDSGRQIMFLPRGAL